MASGKQLYQAILRATRQAQEAQEYKALPKPEDRTDPQNLLERLLGIKEAGGEQLDLPLQRSESGSTKKLTPLQEADRRDARLAEIEEASDEIGESYQYDGEYPQKFDPLNTNENGYLHGQIQAQFKGDADM